MPAATPASVASAARQLPRLAVATSVQESTGQSRENVEDLLMIELGNQPFLQTRGSAGPPGGHEGTCHCAEQRQADTKNAIALGKFAAADYLLYVLVAKGRQPRRWSDWSKWPPVR